MSVTSADIRTVWDESVLQHATVQGYTDKTYTYDVSQDSQFDLARLYSDADGEGPRLNFFLCLVQRKAEPLEIGGGTRYTFEVRLEYYLQQTDEAESTFNTLVDRLEAVDDLVQAALGKTWSATVDYWRGGEPLKVATVTIDERACWKGGFTYTAFKTA
jgi:hypothetical protein